ncbi:MAG TPA: hypothetical protein VE085_00890 [Burkholderiales bacterium]|nr:hypothetical protein [Burkholderiales bacterium]
MERIAALGFVVGGLAVAPAIDADDCHVDLLLGGIYGQSQHIHSSTTPITDKFDLRGLRPARDSAACGRASAGRPA